MGLHCGILKGLTKELLYKVAHFGAGDTKDTAELVQKFQKKISKGFNFNITLTKNEKISLFKVKYCYGYFVMFTSIAVSLILTVRFPNSMLSPDSAYALF